MAKKDLRKAGPPVTLCIGKDCDGAPLPSMPFHIRPDFTHTTPSHHPPRSKKQRLEAECIYDKKKKKFTGDKCVERDDDGACISQIPDSFCKATSKPCDADRASCPVQLIFIKGKPNLRFCREKGKPGYILPAGTPAQAQRKAKKACANWKKHKTTFFDQHAPHILEQSARKHPKSPWGAGLGQPPAAPEPSGAPPAPVARAGMAPMVPLVGGIVALILAFAKK